MLPRFAAGNWPCDPSTLGWETKPPRPWARPALQVLYLQHACIMHRILSGTRHANAEQKAQQAQAAAPAQAQAPPSLGFSSLVSTTATHLLDLLELAAPSNSCFQWAGRVLAVSPQPIRPCWPASPLACPRPRPSEWSAVLLVDDC